MTRAAAYSLRCALVALLALAIVAARPAMMLAHAGDGMRHGCGMSMESHHDAQPSHGEHHCSSSEDGNCCDDCLCACIVGGGDHAVIALTATYTHPAAVASRFSEVVRERRPAAFRLPPSIGPPLSSRS